MEEGSLELEEIWTGEDGIARPCEDVDWKYIGNWLCVTCCEFRVTGLF
ncbi:MAG: hypothetical protein MJB12_19270 [Firmicutes bacterium]|nr:hypothetical protein [Bacillota bacterium]